MRSGQIKRLAELIRGIECAMFTTINPDGSVNSRPMVVQDFDFDGDLWFFTQRASCKVEAINEDSHVCVTFMDPATNRFISVSGTAEVVEDEWTIKKMWTEPFSQWFPDGPLDKNLALIQVKITHGEYWDAPHSEVVENFSLTEPELNPRPRDNGLAHERSFHSW